jgi:hypothetical protein
LPPVFKEEVTNAKCEDFSKIHEDPIFFIVSGVMIIFTIIKGVKDEIRILFKSTQSKINDGDSLELNEDHLKDGEEREET